MGRSPTTSEDGLKKGPWSPEEDEQLIDYINKNGHGSWLALPKRAGLNRCGKSCRLRWTNYLRPDIKRGRFSEEEEEAIINLHSIHGNKWSTIASHLQGRTDNEIKNYWNTHLRKKLIKSGLNPQTHEPIYDFNLLASLSQLQSILNFCNLINPLDQIMMNNINIATFQEHPLFPTSNLPQNQASLDYFLGVSNMTNNNNNAYPFSTFSNGFHFDSNLNPEVSANNMRISQECKLPRGLSSAHSMSSGCGTPVIQECKLPPLVSSTSKGCNFSGTERFGNGEICVPNGDDNVNNSSDDESSFFDSLESIVDSESNIFFPWGENSSKC